MAKEASRDQSGNKGDVSRSARRRFSLPAWLDHFNTHDLKVVFRCWAAIWVASLLMFIGPALHSIGIATFFGALLLYIVPPAGIFFNYLIGAIMLLFGMCLAWAWGLLTMKAALAARPDDQTNALLQQLQQQAVVKAQQDGDSVSWAAQKLIHQGFMFDARVTAVFYVLSCIFVYAMARLRAANHKFALSETFGNIVIDLFLLFGPSLPSFNAQLAKVLVEPGAIGIGLGAVCCLLFFPQSTSHAVLQKMEQIVRMTGSSFRTTRDRLAGQELKLSDLHAMRSKTVAAFNAMKPMLAFLPLDFSRGRWNTDDIRNLNGPLRQAMVAHLALLDHNINRLTVDQKVEDLPESPAHNDNQEKLPLGIASHQLQEHANVLAVFKAPELGAIRAQTTELLKESTADVLQLGSECSTFVAECIHTANSRRWFRSPLQEKFDDLVTKGEDIRERLRSARSASLAKTTEGLIEQHADIFDENGYLKYADFLGPHTFRGLVLGMVVEDHILASAAANEDLLAYILQLLRSRRQNRTWFPSGLRYALSWLLRARPGGVSGASLETGDNPDEVENQHNEVYHELRLIHGPGARRGQGLPSRIIRQTYNWFTNPSGLYALRMVVVTIATAIPSAIPSTADFYYREKGIWGIITAQIAVVIYMSDFTFSVLGRIAGTIVGGIIGMVAWYIGSGHGPGNAYGLAAITAAASVILVWWRLFLPPMMTGFAVMCGATFVLVMGFSYDNEHTTQYGLPGQGYEAFYKRVVTVLLGLVAAFIVQIFPRPPSANRHIRKTLSRAIHRLSDHYALLLSHWNQNKSSPIDEVSEQISLNLAESLITLQGPIHLLKFEISLGSLDQETLRRTQGFCQDMNQALCRLLIISDSLPLELQDRLARTLGFLDDNIVSGVMAILGVIEQSLKSGDPLPERLPTPLVKRCYEYWSAKDRSAEFSSEIMRDPNYRRYCVAVSLYVKFLSAIDELVIVLKMALGESHIVYRSESAVV